MDISEYFTNPNPDGNEWIKRKILTIKWDLRRTIEEVEFFAEQYQLKKKYKSDDKTLEKIEKDLKTSLEKAHDLAIQIRDFS